MEDEAVLSPPGTGASFVRSAFEASEIVDFADHQVGGEGDMLKHNLR